MNYDPRRPITMPNGFPCPNPTCTHQFAADSVKGAAALTCPVCGTVFHFRSVTSQDAGQGRSPTKRVTPRKTDAVPLAKPAPSSTPQAAPRTAQPVLVAARAGAAPKPPAEAVRPAPVAQPVPVATLVPPAASVAPREEIDSLIVVPSLVSRRSSSWKRGRSRGLSARVVALAVLACGVLAVVAITGLGITGQLPAPLNSYWNSLITGGGNGPSYESRKLNYGYRTPGRPWTTDSEVKNGLKAEFAMRRSSPNRWLAIVAKDYKDRNPRDSDLYDEVVSRLRVYFQNLEYAPQPADGLLGGKPARAIEFQGMANNVLMNGQCLLLAHQGFGYWFLTWAPLPEKEEASGEWPELQDRFALLHERDGWKERLRKQITVNGENAPYQLRFAESIWEKRDQDGFDEATDLVLLGSDPNELKHASRTATVQVLLLPPKESLKEAAAAALEYLPKMYKAANYPDTEIKVLTDKDGDMDRTMNVGDREGQVTYLHIHNDENRERYVLLAVVPLPEKVVVIHCECDMQRRDFWQQEFLPLLETFRAKSGK